MADHFPGPRAIADPATPVHGNDGARPVQAGTCTTPDGRQVSFQAGEPARAHGLRIFAGAGQDGLSIVAETDIATVSGPGCGPLVAVLGETVTSGGTRSGCSSWAGPRSRTSTATRTARPTGRRMTRTPSRWPGSC